MKTEDNLVAVAWLLSVMMGVAGGVAITFALIYLQSDTGLAPATASILMWGKNIAAITGIICGLGILVIMAMLEGWTVSVVREEAEEEMEKQKK